MSDPPVAVAGGGVAGLAAALAIARAERAVHVFERADAPSDEGAGIQLSPNATRHLREWGVLDRLSDAALTPQSAVVRRGRDGAALAKLDLRDAETRYGAPFRIVHRADLHRAIADLVDAEPRIEMAHGAAVVGWRAGEGGRTVLVDTQAGEREASALIIADGVGSKLRENFEPGAPLRPSGRIAWRALVPMARCPAFAREAATNLWLGANAHVVHYPLRGGQIVNIVAVVHGTLHADAQTATSAPAAFSQWCRDIRDLAEQAEEWRAWPLFTRRLPRALNQGRVAVAGDAAHPMLPFLAQGGAQAIEDAAALGAAITASADMPEALERYDRARLSRVTRVVAASERQGFVYHLSGTPAQARDIAMRLGGARALRAATDWLYRT